MKCSQCSADLVDGAQFCSVCGSRIAALGAPSGTPAGDPPPPDIGPDPTMRYAPPGSQVAASANPWLMQAWTRTVRVVRLDAAVFAELRTDASATPYSLVIVAAAIALMGLGGYLWFAVELEASGEIFWKSTLVGGLILLAMWAGWMGIAYVILTNFYHETVRFDEVLRIGGASAAPLALSFFMFIPGITFGVGILGVAVWLLYSIVGLHHGLDVSLDRAALAVLAGFALWLCIVPLIVTTDNPLGPGLFLFDALKDAWVDFANYYSTFE